MTLAPFLRSPITDLTGFVCNQQFRPDTLCAKIEMRLYDCFEAYGVDNGARKCKDLIDDYQECMFNLKQDARTHRMQYERAKQNLLGEREKPYEPPPKLHAF